MTYIYSNKDGTLKYFSTCTKVHKCITDNGLLNLTDSIYQVSYRQAFTFMCAVVFWIICRTCINGPKNFLNNLYTSIMCILPTV